MAITRSGRGRSIVEAVAAAAAPAPRRRVAVKAARKRVPQTKECRGWTVKHRPKLGFSKAARGSLKAIKKIHGMRQALRAMRALKNEIGRRYVGKRNADPCYKPPRRRRQ